VYGSEQSGKAEVGYPRFLDSVHLSQALLRKVIAKVGGPFSAAKQLGISPWTLNHCLRGGAALEDDVLQRAMNIVREKSQGHPLESQTRQPPLLAE
jgi:hypothetical protein